MARSTNAASSWQINSTRVPFGAHRVGEALHQWLPGAGSPTGALTHGATTTWQASTEDAAANLGRLMNRRVQRKGIAGKAILATNF